MTDTSEKNAPSTNLSINEVKKPLSINDACIGCGTCAHICPDRFEMDGSKAKVKDGTPTDLIQTAKESCPVGAIVGE